jgi:hypothetical protein
MDTPDGLYCKLPQDSPIDVRGARNYPCVEHPGKRAATVQECDSDKPFTPLAMRQHVLGPNPIDPNLIAQGIAPDRRVDPGATLYAPVEGTPLPPGQPPAAVADVPPPPEMPPPADEPGEPPPGDPGVPAAAQSSFANDGATTEPSVAVAQYNPQTGAYMAADGHLYHQANVTAGKAPNSWTDLMPGPSQP